MLYLNNVIKFEDDPVLTIQEKLAQNLSNIHSSKDTFRLWTRPTKGMDKTNERFPFMNQAKRNYSTGTRAHKLGHGT